MTVELSNVRCPLMAHGGHSYRAVRCLVLEVKRTSMLKAFTSAFDPKRTSGPIVPSKVLV
jgi:hypothetical protein